MQGKNSVPRYQIYYIDSENNLKKGKKYTCLQDISKELNISRPTCDAIIKNKSKYCRFYKIEKI